MSIPPQSGGPLSLDSGVSRLPQRSLLADEVYTILRDDLISHRIAPGSSINLDQLARQLHVSNTPVRQALARLESDGLVTKEPFRGFAASQLLDSHAIAELYDYRLLIEPPIAALAARRRRDAHVNELEALCDYDQIAHLVATAPNGTELGQRDVDFHCCIARYTGNQIVLDNISQTLSRMRLYSAYHRAGAGELAWEEHRAVAAAIRALNPDAAHDAMRAHLTRGLERMREALQ
jgi:DNA-binding GntR family transcriptional regulator